MYYSLFPQEMSLGKAPGLLLYEKYFTIGILLFSLDFVLKYLFNYKIFKIANSLKSGFVQRFLFLYPSLRFKIPVLIFLILKRTIFR
jgi:hypothetical protein